MFTARALLDNGSQHSFISEKLFKRLNTKPIQSTIRISGVGTSTTQSNKSYEIIIRSKINDYSTKIRCYILQHITSSLPTTNIGNKFIRIPKNIRLADPSFNISSAIDLLIGADLFWELLLNDNRIRLEKGPYLQNSKLGWLLCGPLYTSQLKDSETDQGYCNFNQTLDDNLKRFWELENVSQSCNILTADERVCEDLFKNTTKRDINGRFSVRIPLKQSPDALGDSYNLAKNRFFALERKLERRPEYKRLYRDFINEYESLGHMTRVNKVEYPNFFLPHHGVFKEHSSTTKLRVVFDASATTTSSKSLNDIQYPGPALQNDIFSILLRFRRYKYVACADVEKMFRQVLVQEDQRSLQYIVWRDNPTDPLGIYQLNTVTYGTASAPYLSMRCIRQIAYDCDDVITARVITEDLFVDDLVTGSDDHHELISICEKVSAVLRSGCFVLRKWIFNSELAHAQATQQFNGEHTQNKTLGIGWYSESDYLYYTTQIDDYNNIPKLTKRVMLSIISQIYDPLGLLSPTIIISKILLQKLWLSRLDWDTPVPHDIEIIWNKFVLFLKRLNELNIPRYVMSGYTQYKELHIFTDASQSAYGACAYVRTYNHDSEIVVKLLCAKTKVAPLKSISIPRLELCGALIGARLYKKIIDVIRLTFSRVIFWTDSTIVIGWVKMSPHLLKPFVQNRVTELNELTGNSEWLHVSSENNPADILSRGLAFDSLINCELWWNGPSYLQCHNNFDSLNNNIINLENLPDLKSNIVHNFSSFDNLDFIQFNKYSSFTKLKRVWAYVLRFINNVRGGEANRYKTKQTGLLSVSELDEAQYTLIRFAQMQSFPRIYNNLLNKRSYTGNNKEFNRVTGLNVFLDDKKLIRVGGRLRNASNFDFNKKHPFLMCSRHWMSNLLVNHEHKRLLHAGPQLILYTLRETWWILSARGLVRKIVRQCVTCSRFNNRIPKPIMGNLPSERLDAGFPFERTGVDYAGPIMIMNRKGRGARQIKSYICLFVCFITKAVHIELVTSLSTDDYILALKRFIGRRGKPVAIYSDNGRNFVGAEKEIRNLIYDNSQKINDYTSCEGIDFNFTPPYAPHFGGLWESGVRSCKHHLKRIVGNAKLTYEEMNTVLIQIEAVLNSRPLSPLSTDPTDFTPLTPGHFLTGRPLTSLPCETISDATGLTMNRYRRVEQLRQQFWRRWSREYIGELQHRTKWKTHHDDIAIDRLVLIKDENLPPLKWRLGRITRIYPGTDGVTRVADIRTATGTTRRAFSKICPLPLQPSNDEA
ncbi:unnamed protein product [Euphydryas editha]|uniref:Endonuclease n=1 Tax=Euphydryas editha TaxID=104508 RepID=A0AAU9UE69_EUPED|nr:unnamed protein product [Euphydryas editha]